jgi:hypothetical protein
MRRKGFTEPNLSHEHEWEPIPELYPVFEDWAAMFHERCTWEEIVDSHRSKRYDEVFYETGASCEETRNFRFDLAKIDVHDTGEVFDYDDIWADDVDARVEELAIGIMEPDSAELELDRRLEEGYFLPDVEDSFEVEYKNRTYTFQKK